MYDPIQLSTEAAEYIKGKAIISSCQVMPISFTYRAAVLNMYAHNYLKPIVERRLKQACTNHITLMVLLIYTLYLSFKGKVHFKFLRCYFCPSGSHFFFYFLSPHSTDMLITLDLQYGLLRDTKCTQLLSGLRYLDAAISIVNGT